MADHGNTFGTITDHGDTPPHGPDNRPLTPPLHPGEMGELEALLNTDFSAIRDTSKDPDDTPVDLETAASSTNSREADEHDDPDKTDSDESGYDDEDNDEVSEEENAEGAEKDDQPDNTAIIPRSSPHKDLDPPEGEPLEEPSPRSLQEFVAIMGLEEDDEEGCDDESDNEEDKAAAIDKIDEDAQRQANEILAAAAERKRLLKQKAEQKQKEKEQRKEAKQKAREEEKKRKADEEAHKQRDAEQTKLREEEEKTKADEAEKARIEEVQQSRSASPAAKDAETNEDKTTQHKGHDTESIMRERRSKKAADASATRKPQERIRKSIAIDVQASHKFDQEKQKSPEEKRESIRRGKRIADGSTPSKNRRIPTFADDETDNEDVTPLIRKKKPIAKKKGTQLTVIPKTDAEWYEAFKKIDFTHTRYPDIETIERLGIKEDVLNLINYCGLMKYMFTPQVAYKDLCAQFLSTVNMKDVNEDLMESTGGGHITYQLNGDRYTRTFKQIQEHFEFPEGTVSVKSKFDDKEEDELWDLLTGDGKFDGKYKTHRIRHPAVAYVRRAITETLFPREETGPVSTSDFHILIRGLKQMLGTNFVTKKKIVGDEANQSLAYILCKQLVDYKGKIKGTIKKNGTIAPIGLGGPITEIIKMKPPKKAIDWTASRIDPGKMNLQYLRNNSLLFGEDDRDPLIYKFQLEGIPDAHIVLPRQELTSLSTPENIRFQVPHRFLQHVGRQSTKKNPVLTYQDPVPQSGPQKKKRISFPTITEIPTITDEQRAKIEEEITPIIETTVMENLRPVMIAEVTRKVLAQFEASRPAFEKTMINAILEKVAPDISEKAWTDLAHHLKTKVVALVKDDLETKALSSLQTKITEDLKNYILAKEDIHNQKLLALRSEIEKQHNMMLKEIQRCFVQIPGTILPVGNPSPTSHQQQISITSGGSLEHTDPTNPLTSARTHAIKRPSERTSSPKRSKNDGNNPKKHKKNPPTPPSS